MTLSITMICYYAECRVLFIIMQSVIVLNVVMPSVVAPFLQQCRADVSVIKQFSLSPTWQQSKLERLYIAKLFQLF